MRTQVPTGPITGTYTLEANFCNATIPPVAVLNTADSSTKIMQIIEDSWPCLQKRITYVNYYVKTPIWKGVNYTISFDGFAEDFPTDFALNITGLEGGDPDKSQWTASSGSV